ncbi:hypothetical protein OC861_005793 [Tilletia horrida]|nr:hypothetical protein OC845_001786 [Tilletia horrida]KAK0561498.1 hypothetical protein OC861_005793 [Tilletia horrida]
MSTYTSPPYTPNSAAPTPPGGGHHHHHQHHRRAYFPDGHSRSTSYAPSGAQTPAEFAVETPRTLLGQTVRNSLTKLEDRLSSLAADESSTSWAGDLARSLLSTGNWVRNAVEEEWELRANAVSGADQMWVLLSPPEFGPPHLSSASASWAPREGQEQEREPENDDDGASKERRRRRVVGHHPHHHHHHCHRRQPRRGFAFVPTCTATYLFEREDTDSEPRQDGESSISKSALREALQNQADTFPRYKSVLRNTGRRFHGAVFREQREFSVDNHIQYVRLPEGSGQDELEDFVASFIASPWDFSKPLWECAVVSNFLTDKGSVGDALIVRGHHSLADGQGFVFSQLLNTSFGPELRAKLADGQKLLRDARRGRAKPSKLHKALRPLDKYRHYTIVQLLMLFAFWYVWAITQVLELVGSFRQAVVTGSYFALTSWRQRYLSSEYSGPRTTEKEFSVTPQFPMSEVKSIQRAFSGVKPGSWLDRHVIGSARKNKIPYRHLTLNDVLCTVIADVMAEEAHNQEPSREASRGIWNLVKSATHHFLPSPIALFIPISIRPLQVTPTMENWSTGSIAYLPSPLRRDGFLHGQGEIEGLYEVLHRNSDALKVVKRGWIPALLFWSIQMTGQVPWLYPAQMWDFWPIRPLMRAIVELSLTSFQAVLTNVPGPPEAVELAGRKVAEWGAAPPQAGKNTLAIGVITYAGSVSVTFTADRVVGEPSEGVARRLADSFAQRWELYVQAAETVLGGE